MLNMQKFHKLLFTDLDNQSFRLRALRKLTRTQPRQLNHLTADLAWQQWGGNHPVPG